MSRDSVGTRIGKAIVGVFIGGLFAVALATGAASAATHEDELLAVAMAFWSLGWVSLAVWTFVDAWRRGDSPLAWGLLTLFLGPVGWAVYLVSRRSPQKGCPLCGHPTRSEYLVCPQCGGHLRPRCRACGRALTAGWMCCPYCATPMTPDPVAAALEEIDRPTASPQPAAPVCPYYAQAMAQTHAAPCMAPPPSSGDGR